MFALVYSEGDKVAKSALKVRKLHDKVKGSIGEDIGIFKKDSEFSANNLDAVFWVQATLVEGAVYMYELFNRKLTEKEKDEYLYQSRHIAAAFGVPEEYCPTKWKDFMRRFKVMLNSEALVVSKDAKTIDLFLWKPPSGYLAPLLNQVRRSTAVMLPPRLAEEFYPRKIGKIDTLLWCLLAGLIRFIYRLLPYSVRWLTPYLRLQERMGLNRSVINRLLMSFSQTFANFGLRQIMPQRN